MSDGNALIERIDALEMRLTYQDEAIETLNQTVTMQWLEIDRLKSQLSEMKARLQEAERLLPLAAPVELVRRLVGGVETTLGLQYLGTCVVGRDAL